MKEIYVEKKDEQNRKRYRKKGDAEEERKIKKRQNQRE